MAKLAIERRLSELERQREAEAVTASVLVYDPDTSKPLVPLDARKVQI